MRAKKNTRDGSWLLVACVTAFSAQVAGQACAEATDAASEPTRPASAANEGDQSNTVGAQSKFEAIAVRGRVHLIVTQSTRQNVKIDARSGASSTIDTRVVHAGGLQTLEVRGPAGGGSTDAQTVHVDVATLKRLVVHGASDVSVQGFEGAELDVTFAGAGKLQLSELNTERLTLHVLGSGNVESSGRAKTVHLTVTGSGDVDLRALAGAVVGIANTGSGNTWVKATDEITGSITGSGDLFYAGSPSVQVRNHGRGTIRPL